MTIGMGSTILRALLAGALLVAGTPGCSSDADADPATEPSGDGWRRLADPPLSPRDHAVLVGMGDRVLLVGGWEFLCPDIAACAAPSDPLFADGALYDATSDSWRPISPAPFGLRGEGRSPTVLDGTAYLVSNCSDGPDCAAPPRLLSYRPDDDQWTDHGPVPGPEYIGSVLPVGRTLVISGADDGGGFTDAVFTPDSSTWTELPDDPLPPVFDRFLVAEGDQLVLAGSPITAPGVEAQPPKVAARLDLADGRWTALPDAPGQGYELFPTDRGPLLAGSARGEPNWLMDPDTWTWTAVRDSTSKDEDVDGVVDRERATYLLEDSLGGPVYSTTVVFDSAAESFVTLRPPPGREDVSGGSSTALGRDLVIHGGQRWSGGYDGELVGDAWLWTAPHG